MKSAGAASRYGVSGSAASDISGEETPPPQHQRCTALFSAAYINSKRKKKKNKEKAKKENLCAGEMDISRLQQSGAYHVEYIYGGRK